MGAAYDREGFMLAIKRNFVLFQHPSKLAAQLYKGMMTG